MTATTKDYADAWRLAYQDKEHRPQNALQKAINRMLAHCIIIEKSGLPFDHDALADYKNELLEFDQTTDQMLDCLATWDIHADSFDVEDE